MNIESLGELSQGPSARARMKFFGAMVPIAAAVVMLTACERAGSKFVVGDCVTLDVPRERWEDPFPIKEILEVGRKSYRSTSRDVSFYAEDIYRRVPCESRRAH